MKKRLATALAGGAALMLALSGCGDDNSEELNAWAKKVCDGVQPQAARIQAANASIQEESSDKAPPKDVKETDSKAFQEMSDAYRKIGSVIDQAGPPAVENGEKKQQDAVKELNSIADSYADLKKQVDKLKTDDQAEFADGLKEVGTQLQKLSGSGSDALKRLEEGEVGEAMRGQASCKAGTGEGAGDDANSGA
ncbi:small secreted protein [Streptomyces abyssomicinicus]|uniref:small secreted protein n=1 Tax=Streptomyces abyssomicinicus TaxID=574929 RepID=UPI00124FD297|nr:small secreted protein [Streptomyces abyssomicinicus]